MTKQLHLPPIKHLVSRSLQPCRKVSHSRNSRTNPRHVSRGILRPKDCTSTDPTNAPESHKHRTAQCALPLAADVVGLVCQRRGDVGIRTGGDEEDAEIASAAGGGESHDGEADEGDEGVGDEDGATDVEFVADIGREDHEEDCEGILVRMCVSWLEWEIFL